MTEQEIQERNKEIALMLGAVDYKADKWYKLGGYKQHIYFPNRTFPNRFLEHQLKFHSDWNWLMEAVKFIEKLDGSYSISNKSCAISVDEPYWFGAEIIVKTNESIHEAVFIAVSDFAKLYNEGEL